MGVLCGGVFAVLFTDEVTVHISPPDLRQWGVVQEDEPTQGTKATIDSGTFLNSASRPPPGPGSEGVETIHLPFY